MDSNIDNRRRKFRYRGSLLGPIILITIGVVFLLSNMGYLTGDIWDTILKLWPLLLVAIGLDNVLQGRGLTGPLLFIGLGIVILLSNFELIDWDIWELLLRLWPLLLVAIGLDLVIGRRSTLGAGLAIGILIVIMIVAIWYIGPGQGAVANKGIEVSQTLNQAERADLVLKPTVAGVRIRPLSSSESLLEGTVNQWRGEDVRSDYDVVGGVGELTLQSEDIGSFRVPSTSDAGWDLYLNDRIPLTLDLSLGVGEAELDLQSLKIDEFNIRVAVGKLVLILPAQNQVRGTIENAIGSIRIDVPANIGLRINADTGLTNIQVPEDYEVRERTYTSPEFSSAENQVELTINQAIGLVRVEKIGD